MPVSYEKFCDIPGNAVTVNGHCRELAVLSGKSLVSKNDRTWKFVKLFQNLIGQVNALKDQSVNVPFQHPIHKNECFLIIKIIIAGNDNLVMLHADIADLF